MVLTSCSDCDEILVAAERQRRAAAAEPVAIGAVGDQQIALAVGQRGRLAAQARAPSR